MPGGYVMDEKQTKASNIRLWEGIFGYYSSSWKKYY
jgi:hypothetical protein